MAAMSPPNKQMATLQSWRDRAIERSRVLTDGFEVALSWAGGLADWILFLCLVCNIIEVLAHLAGSAFSNMVMGTQSVLLDIGGFALLTMAVHAHQRQARRTRNSAATVGALLMLVTLATVVLITVGNLWPKAADQVQNINQALILARIAMTIVYEATIHLLRHAEQHEQQVQQANQLSTQLSSELSSAIEQQQQEFTRSLQQLSEQCSRQLSTLAQEFSNQFSNLTRDIAGQQETLTAHEQALTALATLPGIIEQHEHTTRQALAGMRTSLESNAAKKPKLSLVTSPVNTEKLSEQLSSEPGELSSKGFIESYLTTHPEARNTEIIEAAAQVGLTLTQSYVSQVRKAFKEQSA